MGSLNSEQLKVAGIDHCLQKPINQEQLLNQLLSVIDKGKPAAIDWPLCVTRVSGNKKLAMDYLACFIKELRKDKMTLETLYKEKNFVELEKAAHKLHGACCFCGVPTLQHDIANLETVTRHNKQTAKVEEAFIQSIESIHAVISEYESSYELTVTAH